MKPTIQRGLLRASSVLLGSIPVAIAMAWSIDHPTRPGMIVAERLCFPLGTTPGGDYERHSWSVRNEGSFPLKLRTRFTSGRCGFSLWLGEDHFVPVGGRINVSLTCPSPTRGGTAYAGYADVVTSDPESPRVRFRVCGLTRPSSLP